MALVWVLDLSPDQAEGCDHLYPRALRWLSDAERSHCQRLQCLESRRRFVFARAALRRLLGAHRGLAPAALALRRLPGGKPVVPGGPHFNLSHSGHRALLAVSDLAPVGVDVERLQVRPALALARRFFSAAELGWLRRRGTADLQQAFHCLWTAREALLKRTGEGLSGLSGLELAPEPLRVLRGAVCPLWPLDVGPGYVASLASTDPEVRIRPLTLPDLFSPPAPGWGSRW